MSGLHPEIDCSDITHPWLTLQGVEVLRLGPFPFAENLDRLSRLADRNPTLERPLSIPPTVRGHHASLETRPSARRNLNWSSSGTAPNLPWR